MDEENIRLSADSVCAATADENDGGLANSAELSFPTRKISELNAELIAVKAKYSELESYLKKQEESRRREDQHVVQILERKDEKIAQLQAELFSRKAFSATALSSSAKKLNPRRRYSIQTSSSVENTESCEFSSASHEIESLKSNMAEKVTELWTMKNSFDGLSKEKLQIEKELESLRAARKDEFQSFSEREQDLLARLDELETLNGDFREQIKCSDSLLSETNDALANKQNEIDEYRHYITLLESDLETTRLKLEAAEQIGTNSVLEEKENMRALQSQYDQVLEKYSQEIKELERVKARLASLESVEEELGQKRSKVVLYSEHIERLKTELNREKQEKQQIQASLELAQQDLDDLLVAAKTKELKLENNAELIQKLTSANQSLLERSTSLSLSNSDYKQLLAKREEEISRFELKLKEAEASRAEMEIIVDEMQKNRRNDDVSVAASYLNDLENERKTVIAFRAHTEELSKSLIDTKSQLDFCNSEVQQLRDFAASQSDLIDSLKEEATQRLKLLDQRDESIDFLNQKNADLSTIASDLENSDEEARKRLSQTESKLKEMSFNYKKLECRNMELVEELERVSQDLKASEIDRLALEKSLNDLNDTRYKIEAELRASLVQNRADQTNLADLNEEFKGLLHSRENLKYSIVEMESEIRQKTTYIMALQEEIVSMAEKIRLNEETFVKTSNELVDKDEAINRLQELIATNSVSSAIEVDNIKTQLELSEAEKVKLTTEHKQQILEIGTNISIILNDIESVQRQNEQLLEELAAIVSVNRILRDRIDVLIAEIASKNVELKEMETGIFKITNDSANCRRYLETTIREKLDELNETQVQLQTLSKQNCSLDSEVKRLFEEGANLKTENYSLHEAIKENQHYQGLSESELSALGVRLSALGELVSSLESDLAQNRESKDKEIADFKLKVLEFSDRIHELQELLCVKEKQLDDALQRAVELQDQHFADKLQHETDKNRKIDQLSMIVDELNDTIFKNKSQADEIRKQCEVLLLELQDTKQEMIDTRAALIEADKFNKDLEQKVSETKSEVDCAVKRCIEFIGNFGRLSHQPTTEWEEFKRDFEKALETALFFEPCIEETDSAKLQDLQLELDNLRRRIHDYDQLQTMVLQLKREKESLQKKLERTKLQNSSDMESGSQLENMKRSHADITTETGISSDIHSDISTDIKRACTGRPNENKKPPIMPVASMKISQRLGPAERAEDGENNDETGKTKCPQQ